MASNRICIWQTIPNSVDQTFLELASELEENPAAQIEASMV